MLYDGKTSETRLVSLYVAPFQLLTKGHTMALWVLQPHAQQLDIYLIRPNLEYHQVININQRVQLLP